MRRIAVLAALLGGTLALAEGPVVRDIQPVPDQLERVSRLGNWKETVEQPRGKSLAFYHLPMSGPEAGWRVSLFCGDDPNAILYPPAHQAGLVALGDLDEVPSLNWRPYESLYPFALCGCWGWGWGNPLMGDPPVSSDPEKHRFHKGVTFRLLVLGTTFDAMSVGKPLDSLEGVHGLIPQSRPLSGISFVRYSNVHPSLVRPDDAIRATAARLKGELLGKEVFAEAQRRLPEGCREEYHLYGAGESPYWGGGWMGFAR